MPLLELCARIERERMPSASHAEHRKSDTLGEAARRAGAIAGAALTRCMTADYPLGTWAEGRSLHTQAGQAMPALTQRYGAFLARQRGYAKRERGSSPNVRPQPAGALLCAAP